MSARFRTSIACCTWAALAGMLVRAQVPQSPTELDPEGQSARRCRIEGHAKSGDTFLPGVSIVAQTDGAVKLVTSTGVDGKYTIVFPPNQTVRVAADLTAFTPVEREVTLGSPPCDATLDFQMALTPRRQRSTGVEGTAGSVDAAPSTGGQGRGSPAPSGRRFQTLNVQPEANGTATADLAAGADAVDVTKLLPPGFSAQAAQADAIALTGSGDAASLDRSLMSSRLEAIRIGDLDPASGQFAGFGVPGQIAGGLPGAGAGNQPGAPFGGRGGGPGGGRGFVLGGRGFRGQNPYQGTVTYTFGGSALDTPPYQLRREVPVTQPQFSKNNFGATFGGPLKVPRLYTNSKNRTNFQVNYTGTQSDNVFDQYATVPTMAMRNGDFSTSAVQLIDPVGGQAFPGNQIPASRVDPGSALLLGFIPAPNLPGASQNYHVSTTAHTSSDNISLRLSENLSKNVVQGGRGAGGGRGGGPGLFGGTGVFGGPGGARGQNGRGTTVMLTGQLQYRRTETEALNVFPNLGGTTTNTSITAPVSLNIVRGRSVQNVTINFAHSAVQSNNAFSGIDNVAGDAGISYPSQASSDPLNWGVPNLLFSGFTGVRSAAASLRSDNRLTTGYVWLHPAGKHRLRLGGDYRLDRSSNENNANARGTFTFTGLYSAGAQVAGTTGADFADFLLGVPQQATLQVGGLTHLRQRSFDAYVEDNWQKNAKLTFNLGLRYELALPYVEVNGQMTNLDVTPTFTAAVPVVAGATGPFTGAFPSGLLNNDVNNLGPRLGVAYRVAKGTVLRGGYGITYNSGSYAAIARQLVAQPPFAETETVIGTTDGPLTLAEALLSSTSPVTNNYGVDRDYALGTIQTWNTFLTRDLTPTWTVAAGYTLTKGTDLDILRAPNRGPDGLLIPGVQAFTWESSGGRSILNAGTFQVRRKLAHGFSGDLSYTLARSMDNASSLGAGAAVVAQNDKDLASEWALSSFDRRHQISGDVLMELPFGANRRWLNKGGLVAALFGDWTLSLNLTAQSGSPFTARVVGAASDVFRGSNGSLRADYTGAPIQLSNPTVDAFFNAAAFTVPQAGMFGDSARNMIVGPGARQLNGVFSRDLRLGTNRVVTLQINATNLLNSVQWASIDTNVNSPTFGQVLSVRPMRTVTVSARLRF